MKTIQLNITQSDIDNGKQDSCTQCPIALSLKRRVKPEYRVLVSTDHIEIVPADVPYFYNDDISEYPISQHIKEFINRFDHGVEERPHQFKVSLPEGVLK